MTPVRRVDAPPRAAVAGPSHRRHPQGREAAYTIIRHLRPVPHSLDDLQRRGTGYAGWSVCLGLYRPLDGNRRDTPSPPTRPKLVWEDTHTHGRNGGSGSGIPSLPPSSVLCDLCLSPDLQTRKITFCGRQGVCPGVPEKQDGSKDISSVVDGWSNFSTPSRVKSFHKLLLHRSGRGERRRVDTNRTTIR